MKPEINLVGFIHDGEWPHYLWMVSIGSEIFEYKTGTGLATHFRNKKGERNPEPVGRAVIVRPDRWVHIPEYDQVLICLFSDARIGDVSMKEFCDDFGYSLDSLLAWDTYRACINTGIKLRKALGNQFYSERERIAKLEG